MSVTQAQTTLDLSDPDVQAIVGIAHEFSKAIENGDLERIVSFYSPDVVKTSPGQPPQRGRRAVEESWKRTLSLYQCHLDVQVDEVKILGSVAYDSASFVMTLTPKAGGEAIHSTGRVFEVVRKEDGKWKSVRVLSMADK